MTAEWRRGLILAGGGLLAGFALVVVLFGAGEMVKRVQGDKQPVAAAALPRSNETSTPESRAAESPAAAGSPVTPPVRREEGASTTPGKSPSGGRGPPDRRAIHPPRRTRRRPRPSISFASSRQARP